MGTSCTWHVAHEHKVCAFWRSRQLVSGAVRLLAAVIACWVAIYAQLRLRAGGVWLERGQITMKVPSASQHALGVLHPAAIGNKSICVKPSRPLGSLLQLPPQQTIPSCSPNLCKHHPQSACSSLISSCGGRCCETVIVRSARRIATAAAVAGVPVTCELSAPSTALLPLRL